MDFRDSPDEAAFRERLRVLAFDARQGVHRLGRRVLGPAGRMAPAPCTQQRLLRPVLARGIRRAGAAAGLRRHRRRGDWRAPARRRGPASGYLVHRHWQARQRGTAAAVPARHDRRHRALVPGLQRARRRFGSGLADHHRHPRRRQLRDHGHKIWTSYSDVADWCLLLARTDPECQAAQGHVGVHRSR